MKKFYLALQFIILLTVITDLKSFGQNVGINGSGAVPHAAAMLHVDLGTDKNRGLLITGTLSTTALIPNIGRGSRLMFYPAKSAFRAGWVNGSEWDNVNVGRHSVAMGVSTIASGVNATAIGIETIASGESATAMGEATNAIGANATAMGAFSLANGPTSTALGLSSTASGSASTAMGFSTHASGANATAMGANTSAVGDYSTAMGYETIASGQYSTALGYYSDAGGQYSTAIGYNSNAGGNHSNAIGYNTNASGMHSFAAGSNVSTNSKTGAFFFGDSDPNNKGMKLIGFNNQFATRFNGGYYFISSNAGADIGVQVLPGGNAWVAMCDENRKENFEPLDGEDILEKMKGMKFSSWNYKTQDPTQHRHYGIMAQDFFQAFGNDKYGKIGNDTTVNPIDMIGIDMAAIQALEKRTAQLADENMQLRNEMNKLLQRLEKIERVK